MEIENFGATSLYTAYISNTTPPVYFVYKFPNGSTYLKYQGEGVLVGSTGAWQPIGAEAMTSLPGFAVVWRYGFSDQYKIWQTDLNGNYVGETNLSGSSNQLQSLETNFHQADVDSSVAA